MSTLAYFFFSGGSAALPEPPPPPPPPENPPLPEFGAEQEEAGLVAIKKGSIGVQFVFRVLEYRVNTGLETFGQGAGGLTTATTKNIYLIKPDSSTVVVPGSFYTLGEDSVLTWTTTSRSDLDQVGQWYAAGHIVALGYNGSTEEITFVVTDNKFTLPPP